MNNQNVMPYRRQVEDEQAAIASQAASLLIKGLHRVGGQRPLNKSADVVAPEVRRKQEQALATIAATPRIDTDKPLAAQIPNLKQDKLPGEVGQSNRDMIVPISGNDMSALSDAAIADIVKNGLDTLPDNPVSEDYAKFANTRAARQEEFKRAMSASSKSARLFTVGPTTMA